MQGIAEIEIKQIDAHLTELSHRPISAETKQRIDETLDWRLRIGQRDESISLRFDANRRKDLSRINEFTVGSQHVANNT